MVSLLANNLWIDYLLKTELSAQVEENVGEAGILLTKCQDLLPSLSPVIFSTVIHLIVQLGHPHPPAGAWLVYTFPGYQGYYPPNRVKLLCLLVLNSKQL